MFKNFTFLLFSIVISLTASSQGIIAGWNVSGLTNGGPATLPATSTDPNLTVTSLTKGSGIGSGAAGNAFGGSNWTATTAAAGVTANTFITTTAKANTGYLASYNSVDYDWRNSGTGASTSLLQYSLDGSSFTDIATSAHSTASPNNGTTSIPLFGILDLQNVPASTTVTFRLIPYGASASGGTWYFDGRSAALIDLGFNGTVVTILPITVSPLSASKQSTAVQLDWTMGCTSSNVTYVVERSTDSYSFLPIYKNTVTRERCEDPFQFIDNTAANGTVFYRIRSYDIDGNTKFSDIAKVQVNGASDIKIFPSSTTGIVTVDYNASLKGNSTWMIYNASGRMLMKQSQNLQQGQNRFTLDLGGLPAGSYYISGHSEYGKTAMQQVIKR